MSVQILDGRPVAAAIRGELRAEGARLAARVGHPPAIAVVQMGRDPAADRYVRAIRRAFEEVDLGFQLRALSREAPVAELEAALRDLNADARISGILVQMPLPPHVPPDLVPQTLSPEKDVDGIHPLNAGRLAQGDQRAFVPATPLGGLELLRGYNVPIAGRHAVVVGRSNVVGKPMALLLLHQHATVTIAHSRTSDLPALTRQADILVAATGRPGLIRAGMVRHGAIVVDFGVNVVDGKVVGDVAFEEVAAVAGAITPVPGGTGPMTNVMLIGNTLLAARRAHGAD
ncbi:MAG: bifunctional 5,10-methylene-tetrahydrofolate dehydrogenase/5,10-methylene-tetrahydrofolate cyclohydrolase [Chloroflexi bacterium]|nr:bifunctional 5,10-methylene-tetrahydrofolate dehydrogenase/5,10-methylene-tetrahydrofolate cyclohydrolase [Chloroflexota bacterium]